ncbi:hypothetical protein KUTeg_022508, partial [Tegillarca granosa]
CKAASSEECFNIINHPSVIKYYCLSLVILESEYWVVSLFIGKENNLLTFDCFIWSARCRETNIGEYCEHENPCRAGASLCLNNGTCTVVETNNTIKAHCDCKLGFLGSLCEQSDPNSVNCEFIDFCASQPCRNGGTCHALQDGYQCSCVAGYKGDTCTEDIDECADNPNLCKNGGSCDNRFGSYICHCLIQYTGKHCEQLYVPCSPSPCLNGGTCQTSGTHKYQCYCKLGFRGSHCEVNVDDCIYSRCANGSTCIDGDNSYTCKCPPYKYGMYKHSVITSIEKSGIESITKVEDRVRSQFCEYDVDPCSIQPPVCKNGATCRNEKGGGYSCICVNGWNGTDCSINIDDCQVPLPCYNGGTCIDKVGYYLCKCPVGKTGNYMRKPTLNICLVFLCMENRENTLKDIPVSPKKKKKPLKFSLRCHLVDACLSGPCHAGASCETSPINGSAVCSCIPGWVGSDCSQNVNECSESPNSPCEHNGTCVDTPGSYRCDCRTGFTGPRCEVNVNECASNPCRNDGTCLDEKGQYRCICMKVMYNNIFHPLFTGYTGVNCELEIDECASNPCQNGGICEDAIAKFKCHCQPGFTGPTCATNVNECESFPCRNGAACIDRINHYQCQCLHGYEGVNCERNHDDCVNITCQNGGTCVDLLGGFRCDCEDGYSGTYCDVDINECDSMPCQHGGTCTHYGGPYYECECPRGITGISFILIFLPTPNTCTKCISSVSLSCCQIKMLTFLDC